MILIGLFIVACDHTNTPPFLGGLNKAKTILF
jgi:hypothetical protein